MPSIVSGCSAERLEENVASMARLNASRPTFVYFYADWCPDCARAGPCVDDVFWHKDVDLQLLKVDVGEKAAFKDARFALRLDPAWRLTCVPTLAWVVARAPARRIAEELEACEDAAAARALIARFVGECATGGGGPSGGGGAGAAGAAGAAAEGGAPPATAQAKEENFGLGAIIVMFVAITAGTLFSAYIRRLQHPQN